MRSVLLALSLLLPAQSFADGLSIKDAYLRASGPMARAAAAFMVIHNETDQTMTLIAAETETARKTELHTHIIEDDVARMRPIEGGITIQPGGMHALERGGDHVMLMGLKGKLEQGDMVPITLLFEDADPIIIDVPVDNERAPKEGHDGMDHSKHN